MVSFVSKWLFPYKTKKMMFAKNAGMLAVSFITL